MPFTPTATEAPPFDIMGLLLGGRRYASGWFQNRDNLRQIDLAQQNEVADRQRYAQGVLASPELKAANAAPYDREKQWSLWGNQMAAGPESMVPLANTLLTQSTGNIYDREQAILSNSLAASNIRLSADEQLRVAQTNREREAEQQKGLLEYMFSTDANGDTPGQAQLKRDWTAKQLGLELPQGYSIAPGGDGLVPSFGGKPFEEMMAKGQAATNLINSAEYLQTMMATGQGDAEQYSNISAHMLSDMRKAYELGTLDEGTMKFWAEIVPEYSKWTPDLTNKYADRLGTDIKLWKTRQQQISDQYRVPIEQFSGRKAFQNEAVPSQEEAVKRFGNPVGGTANPLGGTIQQYPTTPRG